MPYSANRSLPDVAVHGLRRFDVADVVFIHGCGNFNRGVSYLPSGSTSAVAVSSALSAVSAGFLRGRLIRSCQMQSSDPWLHRRMRPASGSTASSRHTSFSFVFPPFIFLHRQL